MIVLPFTVRALPIGDLVNAIDVSEVLLHALVSLPKVQTQDGVQGDFVLHPFLVIP